jgi:hypothetical protein
LRFEYGDILWIKAETKPAFEQRTAHLSGADDDKAAGKVV